MRNVLKFSSRILGVVALAALALLGVIALLVHSMFGPDTDRFGRNHPIPEGVAYSIPAGENGAEVESSAPASDSISIGTIILRRAGQGGMYKAETRLPALPAGELWVECRELTEDIPLSDKSIREETLVQIPSSAAGEPFVSRMFRIHEGVWGEYYAARILLWFRPQDAGAESARVLAEAVYRVEGWQR